MKMNDMFAQIDYECEAKKYRKNSVILILIAMCIPVIAYTGILKPNIDSIQIWFQRSGALIVFVSSVAEYHAFKMRNIFSPVKMAIEPKATIKIKYSEQAEKIIYFAAILIGCGTIIWGYGDLLYK